MRKAAELIANEDDDDDENGENGEVANTNGTGAAH